MPALRAGPRYMCRPLPRFYRNLYANLKYLYYKKKKMFKLSINSSFSFPFYPLLCLDYFSILNVLPIIYFSVQLYWCFHIFFLFPLTFSRVIAHSVFIDHFYLSIHTVLYRPISYCLNVSYDLSFSSLPTSINSSRAFPMPIEPCVRLNMLRH